MCPQSVLSKNKKNIKYFHLRIMFFTAVKYCSIIHRHVTVMDLPKTNGHQISSLEHLLGIMSEIVLD